jgi:glutamate synthase domain-containing protein 2
MLVRHLYYLICFVGFSVIGLGTFLFSFHFLHFLYVLVPYALIGFYDITSKHNVLRNYPFIGHLRYMFEFIRPEIQQYFVATNLSGRPFSREQRSVVYQRAKRVIDSHPFGTEHDIDEPGYNFAAHSLHVPTLDQDADRFMVGGPQCTQPYQASRINISGMSYGALSKNAIKALNLGAKMGGFYHNTGEGSLSPHHEMGGDVVWQIGTGYFGCRDLEGNFDPDLFQKVAKKDIVKMIEIKLSQGAKPSHGGILPAGKITDEIARIRHIPKGKDCLSPPMHSTFDTPEGLLHYVQQLRDLSGGKPVGFKLCIGVKSEFMAICKAMLKTKIYPDFITVDGAEGGTGAAPLEYTNRFGLPGDEGLAFVHNCLVGIDLRHHIALITSGKIVTAFDIVRKMALGANIVVQARTMMFAVGCIQALSCHTNDCPTGVATTNVARGKALKPRYKAKKVYNFHNNTMEAFLDMLGAMGLRSPEALTPNRIKLRMFKGESRTLEDVFHYVDKGSFLGKKIPDFYKKDWEDSGSDRF